MENETEAETKVAKCGEASEKGGEAKQIVLSTVRGGPVTGTFRETPTNEAIWKSMRHKDITKKVRDFL